MISFLLRLLGLGGGIISKFLPAGGILGVIGDIISKVANTPQDADTMNAKVKELAEQGKLEELKRIADIVQAEVKSENWLQRSWRPILMLVIILIVANTFLIIPILNLFLTTKLIVVLPDAFYDLLAIGLGGYILSRSAEKIMMNQKNTQTGIGNWKNPDEEVK